MSPAELQELVAELTQRRVDLLATIASMESSSRPVELDQTTQGRLSRIDAISQQQMARAGRANLVTEVSRIDAALGRVERGSYGLCCRCGEEIDIERLRADSAAPFCIDCLEEVVEERRRQGFISRPS